MFKLLNNSHVYRGPSSTGKQYRLRCGITVSSGDGFIDLDFRIGNTKVSIFSIRIKRSDLQYIYDALGEAMRGHNKAWAQENAA